MHFARGNCGHLKAKWDTHLSCLTCNSCTRISPCYICSSWTEKVWNQQKEDAFMLLENQLWRRRENRRNQRNPRSPSQTCLTTGQLMGAPPLIALLLGAGPIKVAAWRWPGTKPTSHQSPVIQSPVNQSPVTQSLGNLSPFIQSPVIRSPVNQSPVNQSTRHQSTRLQSTRHWFTVIRVWPTNTNSAWLYSYKCACTKLRSVHK